MLSLAESANQKSGKSLFAILALYDWFIGFNSKTKIRTSKTVLELKSAGISEDLWKNLTTKIKMSSIVNLTEAGQVLYNSLKCEICYSVPRAGKHRWYYCLNPNVRHHLCQDCKEVGNHKVCVGKACGFISSRHCPISEGFLKLATMRFKCTNESRGCQEILGEVPMLEHESECLFRLVCCPQDTCQAKIQFNKLLEHMTEKNHFYFSKRELFIAKNKKLEIQGGLDKTVTNKGKFYIGPTKLVFDDRVFLLMARKFDDSTSLNFWIQILGSQIEAKNYYYTLEFKGTDPNCRNIYSAQVIPIDESRDAIKEANKYFGMDFKVFQTQFMDEDLNYRISVSIRNMKEELKDDNVESGISDEDDE